MLKKSAMTALLVAVSTSAVSVQFAAADPMMHMSMHDRMMMKRHRMMMMERRHRMMMMHHHDMMRHDM